ncbi:MAG: hypothetical protein JW889_02175 [Verrucomicrobia bacterium]|nr:hypothetical protein [Verrucomicrobiota bacterium]
MADDLKKKLIQYGDKVLFGLFLVVLIGVAAVTLLNGKAPETGGPLTLPPYKAPETDVSNYVDKVHARVVLGGIPEDYVTGGFASDPDEIYARAGERVCPKCAWIVKASVKRCPNCGHMPETDLDKDGLPDDWEMRHFSTLDYGANDDPDGDGFSNIKEYLGGSDPTDKYSIPSPFRLVQSYRKQIEVRFFGYIIKAGGDANVIDPDTWDLQMNYGRGSETTIIPLGGSYKGYKLWPLQKRQRKVDPGGGIPAYFVDVYVLTIQRPGQQPIQLVQNNWATTNETYIDLTVTQGRDTGKNFDGLTIGEFLSANGERFEVAEVHDAVSDGPDGAKPFRVVLKDSEGNTYTLSE